MGVKMARLRDEYCMLLSSSTVFKDDKVSDQSLVPCLIHVDSGEAIRSYSHLSEIMTRSGWRVFIHVTANVWGAWRLGPSGGYQQAIQTILLPHFDISRVSYQALNILVGTIGCPSFQISFESEERFKMYLAEREIRHPVLQLRSNNMPISTFGQLSQALRDDGWMMEMEGYFCKTVEISDENALSLISLIQLPQVQTLDQLSVLDLEYIVLASEDLFYLQSCPSQCRLYD